MIDVVVTTVSDGSFLKRWGELVEQSGRDDVRLVVIPDVNTPDLTEVVAEVSRQYGLKIECPSTDEQVRFLATLGCAAEFVPWRSDNRRNVGFLMSWRDGADVMISVDDDNFPVESTWFDVHDLVTAGHAYSLVTSGEWLNPCEMLEMSEPAYARGFPYLARDYRPPDLSTRFAPADVSINAGLWVNDPDVDAVTRLASRPSAVNMRWESVALARNCWAPVNSQNTAIRRDVIPAYWFARMPDWGGRMGDIFSGYFAEACAKHLGHAVRFGTPLVTQERNHHDLLHDLELETPFYRLLEDMLGWLPGVKLEGSTYRDTYESLSWALNGYADNLPGGRDSWFLHETAGRMRKWLDLTDQIGRQ